MYPVKRWKEVLTIISGKNQKAVENPDGKYPIYGSGGVIGRANDYLCKEQTVIVGRKGTINNPIFVSEPFWNIDTAFGVVAGDELMPKFLYYFCCLFNFKTLDKSTGRPSLAKSDLMKIEMPVPSLPEQEHIVARIEELFSELDKAVETLQTTKRKLEVYRQAVLKEAFEGDYKRRSLKSFSKVISGYAFKSKLYSNDGKYTIVKIGNVKNNGFDFSRDLTRTSECTEAILQKYGLLEGDCLITLTGSRGKRDYGYVAIVTGQKNYLLNQRVAAIRFDCEVADPRFYKYYLSSDEFRNIFFSYETGNVGQGNVGINALKEPEVICPPINVQKNITDTIESRLSVCDSIEQTVDSALAQADALRQSILKEAFEGRLE